MQLKAVIGVVFVMLGAYGFKQAQNAPDLSTPQSTVASLLAAYGRHDSAGIAKCVEGGTSAQLPPEILDVTLVANSPADTDQIVEITGDTARVAVKYEVVVAVSSDSHKSKISFVDMLRLHKSAAGWLIVPDKLSSDSDGLMPLATRPLSLVASLLGPDAGFRNAVVKARQQGVAAACLSNVQQLALATQMYVQDYDEVLPRSAAGYNRLIIPYVKNEDMFRCAQDAKGSISYSMNVSLQNRKLADVTVPARTVLLYEGKNGIVDYRHEGRAAFAMADGSAKLMTESEAKNLIWKLAPPTHKKVPTKKRKH